MPAVVEPETPLRRISRADADWADFTVALAGAGLPTEDLDDSGQCFYAHKAARAFGGYFIEAREALLRSIIVPPSARRRGFGRALVGALLAELEARGVERVWLLTIGATPFFESLDFTQVERAMAPTPITATREFQGLCPSSAVLMVRPLQ